MPLRINISLGRSPARRKPLGPRPPGHRLVGAWRLVFTNPPFLPGRDWRMTLVCLE